MKINPQLLDKQKRAFKYLINNEKFEIIYGGAAGGGKSYLGCLWLIIQSLNYPGTRWVMGRKELKNLKQTTLNTFFQVCTKLDLKKDIHYTYNEYKAIITFHNGSEILLKDLAYYPSDPEYVSLGSLEITGAFVDEANQVSKKARDILKTRMRYKLEEYELTPKLLMTCNPSKGWIYNEFFKPWTEGELDSNKAFIPATIEDNKFLPKDYKKNFEGLDNLDKQRLLYGQWNYSDDTSLFNYDALLNSFYIEPDYNGDNYIACDIARLGADKTVLIVANVNTKAKEGPMISVLDIRVLTKARQPQVQAEINDIKQSYNINSNYFVIIDSDGVGGGIADTYRGSQEIMNGSSPMHKENYQNLKTQLYYKLSELINGGKVSLQCIDGQDKETLLEELQIVRRDDIDSDGRLKIISKKKMKESLGRSPDYADALAYLCYAFYLGVGGYKVRFIEF